MTVKQGQGSQQMKLTKTFKTTFTKYDSMYTITRTHWLSLKDDIEKQKEICHEFNQNERMKFLKMLTNSTLFCLGMVRLLIPVQGEPDISMAQQVSRLYDSFENFKNDWMLDEYIDLKDDIEKQKEIYHVLTYIFCTTRPCDHETQKLSHDQRSKIHKMENIHNHKDKNLDPCKLIIYNWKINNVRKYCTTDLFCVDYCIDEITSTYEWKKQDNQCAFELSQKVNLSNLIYGNSKQQDYKMAKILCLYFVNKKICNDINSRLFIWWMDIVSSRNNNARFRNLNYIFVSIDNNNGYPRKNYALLNNK